MLNEDWDEDTINATREAEMREEIDAIRADEAAEVMAYSYNRPCPSGAYDL